MAEPEAPVPFRDAVEAWAVIAANSFGGPAGQIAVMHRVLVEERKWVGEERFLHALNYCMLLPGPEAQQLVTWTGFVTHGLRGALLAGWLFVLPGFVSILTLSVLYVRFVELPAVAAALLGLKAAVLAVVVEAMVRIGRRVLSDAYSYALAIVAFLALFVAELPYPVVIGGALLLGLVFPGRFPPPRPPAPKPGEAPPEKPPIDRFLDEDRLPHVHPSPRRDVGVALGIATVWLAPVLALALWLGTDATATEVGAFFAQAALLTFGGAYGLLGFVAQEAVEAQGWLTAGEMLDGLGIAETTPGPLIQVVQFVGFLATYRDPGALPPLLSGFLGSVLTTWVTFWPSFGFILAGGPYVERVRKMTALSSALRAVTCAVVGVIGNLALWLALNVCFGTVDEVRAFGLRLVVPDVTTAHPLALGIALAAGVAMLVFHVRMMPVLGASALVGLLGWLATGVLS